MATVPPLKNPPVRDVILDLRFEPTIELGVVPGVLWSNLAPGVKMEPLPHATLPPEIRSNDISMKYSPLYRCQMDGVILGIGDRVITINKTPPNYHGWGEFSATIGRIAKQLETTRISGSYSRIGLRYLNMISPSHKYPINADFIHPFSSSRKESNWVDSFDVDGASVRLGVVNPARANYIDGKIEDGILLDIDASVVGELGTTSDIILSECERLHDIASRVFMAIVDKNLEDWK